MNIEQLHNLQNHYVFKRGLKTLPCGTPVTTEDSKFHLKQNLLKKLQKYNITNYDKKNKKFNYISKVNKNKSRNKDCNN